VTGPRTWPAVLSALLSGTSLEADDTAWAMGEIMAGAATPAQLAAFAVLLRAKGETPAEHAGLVTAMLDSAAPVELAGPLLDVVGTGGDRADTVNLSTMSALVAAGAGARVAKHGNRAASSSAGAADVLEALGVVIALPAAAVVRCVDEAGIGFCFAPVFHPGMRHAGAPRREIGVPTVFNFLGPLTNPARPTTLAVGCSDARMAPIMAAVLADRGDRALVFRGDDGLDELTTTTTSRVWIVQDGSVVEERLDPSALGVPPVDRDALRGGDAAHNAAVARSLLAGERGPVRDAVLLNAGAALAAYDGLGGASLADAVAAGMRRAAAAIDSGAAADVLDRWVAVSQAAAKAG
jgi:anthranilate phosphoribosyltransferase